MSAPSPNFAIHGYCDDRFTVLREVFTRNFVDGLEIGAALALTHHGRMVVDLWAGIGDKRKDCAWERDTITKVNSTTKVMTLIAFLQLIDRRRIDIDAPVASYWPDFAAGGKAAVTVRDALTHQAGVPGFVEPISNAVLCDWAAVTARIAAEPHWFGGERRVCYHTHTWGFLVGELMRRVDGRKPAQIFRDEIAEPAGVDFQIGLASPAELARVAPPTRDRDLIVGMPQEMRKFFYSVDMADVSSWDRMSLPDPGGGGYGNARSIARGGAIIANGGLLEGRRYIAEETVTLAGREQASGVCAQIGPVRFGLGFGLDSAPYPAPSQSCMHWGGLGGSQAIMDPRTRVSFGYTPNHWRVPVIIDGRYIDLRIHRYFEALAGLLKELEASP